MHSTMFLMTVISAAMAEPVANVTEPPAYAEFLIIPIQVHVLSASDLPEVDCKLKDPDIDRVIAKVNGIWHMAGIHFGMQPLLREPAGGQDRFLAMREITGQPSLDSYTVLVPEADRSDQAMHVYYVHKLPVNGVYFGDRTAFVQETASLREVDGGIDEPLPRVTSHELGHALTLVHRQDTTNLMASGTTGTILNTAEVQQAREAARQFPGCRTVAEVHHAALTAPEPATTKRLLSWLAEIPGAEK